MPQPIHYSHQIDFSFSAESLLDRPALAAHIAVISTLWNDVDARIAAFLAALAGPSEAETVIAMFHAITNDGAKRAATDAVVSLKLNKQDREEFQEILKTVGRRYVDRNAVIHGSWGTSPLYPDRLLWCDAREMTMLWVDLMGIEDSQERDARFVAAQKKIMAYSEADFVEMRERLSEAYDDLREFTKPFLERSFGAFAKVDLPPKLPLPQ